MSTITQCGTRDLDPAEARTRPSPSPRRRAFVDVGSVAFGMIPFGVTLGIAISVLGFGTWAGLLGAPAVYGGSAQLTAVTLVHQGVTLAGVVISAAVVNSRLLLYSASLSWRFRNQPAWFSWLGPHFLIDQTFMLASARTELDERAFRRYWGWLGTSVLVVWTSSIGLGMVAGPYLPSLPDLGFVGAALFIGMLAPRLTDRPSIASAVVGGLVAAGTGAIRPELGIICGALAGVVAGSAAKR
jgi:predicted branched-subunit amino acid permease